MPKKNNVIDARKKFRARAKKVRIRALHKDEQQIRTRVREKLSTDKKKDFGFKRKVSNTNKELINVRTKTGVGRTSKIKKAELNKVEASILFKETDSRDIKGKEKAKKGLSKATTKLGKVTVKAHDKETRRLRTPKGKVKTSMGGSLRKLIRNPLTKMIRKRTR